MSQLVKCSFNKAYLERAKLLYIESEDLTRNEANEIFAVFFKKVLIAKDAEEGLNVFIENRSKVDIILLDINMPNSKGLELLEEIRKIDWNIPVIIVAAFTEVEILLKSIKYNITNYIVKPMQLNTTLKIISQLMEVKEQKKEIARKDNELKQFISILDASNIICEMDLEFNILSANDSFLVNSGYELSEVIGKKINDKAILCNYETQELKIQDSLLKGKTWIGLSKRVAKDGTFYYTHSTILPIFHNDGKVKKFIEFATLISKYENEILALKKHILLLKTENFKAHKDLKSENQFYVDLSNNLQKEIDKSVENTQKYLFELYELKKQNTLLFEKLRTQEKRFEEFQSAVFSGQ
ncbi:MAG: response regulator [Aliarcobacter sp.]|nr:response regulator [Aliarcobacter sp.]